jgi:hypothetical protein
MFNANAGIKHGAFAINSYRLKLKSIPALRFKLMHIVRFRNHLASGIFIRNVSDNTDIQSDCLIVNSNS